MNRSLEVFGVALRLGLTSFGGPVAHLGCFRREYVERLGWLDEEEFAGLVSCTQFLPGPASSQLGYAIGLKRAGVAGGLLAWLGFTLPSMILMIGAATGLGVLMTDGGGWIRGLQMAVVAVVLNAVVGMWGKLCRGLWRGMLAVVVGVLLFFVREPWAPMLVIAGGAMLFGMVFRRKPRGERHRVDALSLPGWLAPLSLGGFGAGVVVSLVWGGLFGGLFVAGSLVFGGGHVVLPFLENVAVADAGMSSEAFLAGYGSAQALPGPLFAFAAYLGASLPQGASVWGSGILAACALFLPGILLVNGLLGSWESMRLHPRVGAAVAGANAAVVGVLGAAWVGIASGVTDYPWLYWILAGTAFASLYFRRLPSWGVVALCAGGGELLGRFVIG